ncbi:MAG TPA: ATP-binding protein [Gemmatimonadaceae bacterium]|jgi:signal transduction histidine kinase
MSPSPSRRASAAPVSSKKRHTSAAARGLLAAAERDLQQIILDIHDGPVQDIFGALSQIQVLRHRPEMQVGDGSLVLARIAASLERALGEIRNFIGAFRPPEFERRPLSAILEQLVVQHESLTGTTVDFQLETPLPDSVPLPLKISLYRIIQEALANSTRHAGVSSLEVSARADGRDIVVEVRDHGKGFNVAKVLKSEVDVGVSGGHFGLRGMRDRVAIMNGKMSISSGAKGTVVTIRLPLS